MTPTDFALAAEDIERTTLVDLHAAASPEARERLGLHLETIGTATVSIVERDPSILLNRALGLGLAAPATRADVEAIAARYAAAGIRRFFLHVHPQSQPPELRDWLPAAGLVKARGWMKFRRGPTPPPEVRTNLTVRRIGPEHTTDFGRIVAQGFDLTEATIPLLAGLIDRPGWRLYMSFAGDTPAGTGALFVRDGMAWLGYGATAPEFRQRGGQSAVLRQRIRDAIDLGCEVLLTETGEEVPGDPQHSYRNIERLGFEPAGVRENYAPPKQ